MGDVTVLVVPLLKMRVAKAAGALLSSRNMKARRGVQALIAAPPRRWLEGCGTVLGPSRHKVAMLNCAATRNNGDDAVLSIMASKGWAEGISGDWCTDRTCVIRHPFFIRTRLLCRRTSGSHAVPPTLRHNSTA